MSAIGDCRAVTAGLGLDEEQHVKGTVMRIGLSMPLPAYTIDPAFMGRTAERLGFESIWYAEHPAVPVESASPFPATGGAIPWTYSHFTDPYIALARRRR